MTDLLSTTSGFRERLLVGLTAALELREYHDVTIADIVGQARTSKRTFYEYFDSKQECFLALVRENNDRRRAEVAEAVDPSADRQVQVRQAIEALFGSVHERPTVFLHSLRALRSLGEEGHELVRQDLAAFVDLLQTLSDTPELRAAGITPPSREASIVLVGGLRELIALSLEEGRDPATMIDAATEVTLAVLEPR
ncbi:TetR/AcrR family transcriptional regulator [Nocardioides maradonensis]